MAHNAPDLIRFLIAQGGVQDHGGELRAMDLHRVNKGWFGRLASKSGMTLDYARECAEEQGYLPVGSTISDLLDVLREGSFGRAGYVPEEDPRIDTAIGGVEDEARRLLAQIVSEFHCGGEGKRKRLRVLIREAERMVA